MFNSIPSSVVSDVLASLLLALLGGGGFWVRRQLKDVGQMTKDWKGEAPRPGISDGTPGVLQRLYTQDVQFREVMDHLGRQDSTLALIQHEIQYNSGGSIKDAVHRTDNAVKALTEDVADIKKRMS